MPATHEDIDNLYNNVNVRLPQILHAMLDQILVLEHAEPAPPDPGPLPPDPIPLTWTSVPLRTLGDLQADRPGGEGMQQVMTLAYAPSDPQIVYLGGDVVQCWKSTDGGDSWVHCSAGLTCHGVVSLAVHPTNPNIVLAAGFFGTGQVTAMNNPNRIEGLYRTLDGGASWQLLRVTSFFSHRNKGRLLAYQGTRVLIASHSEGLLVSEDDGLTATVLYDALVEITDIQVMSDTEAYIADATGLYCLQQDAIQLVSGTLPARPYSIARDYQQANSLWVSVEQDEIQYTTDGGQTFVPRGATWSYVLASSAQPPYRLYAKRDQSSAFRNIRWSEDQGLTWQDAIWDVMGDPVFDEASTHFYFSAPIAPHPTQGTSVLTVSNGKGKILKSRDPGAMVLQYSGTGYTGGRVYDMAWSASGGILFGMWDHGVWMNDGQSDVFHYLPIPTAFNLRTTKQVDIVGNTIIAKTGSWNQSAWAISRDLGQTWNVDLNRRIDEGIVKFHPNKSCIFAGSERSDDGGNTWSSMGFVAHDMDATGVLYSCSEQGSDIMVLASQTHGHTWSVVGTIKNLASHHIIEVKGFMTASGTPIVFLGATFALYRVENHVTTKLGEPEGIVPDVFGNFIDQVSVNPRNHLQIYLGKRAPGYGPSNGIFVSHDGGQSWQVDTDPLPAAIDIWGLWHSPDGDTVYVSTSIGTYRKRV